MGGKSGLKMCLAKLQKSIQRLIIRIYLFGSHVLNASSFLNYVFISSISKGMVVCQFQFFYRVRYLILSFLLVIFYSYLVHIVFKQVYAVRCNSWNTKNRAISQFSIQENDKEANNGRKSNLLDEGFIFIFL